MTNVFLSIIIPAYNEEDRIAKTLDEVKDYLTQQTYRSEVIIVDDGSHDVTTEVIKVVDIYHSEFNEQKPSKIINNIKNVGKGFSVACGFIKARGEYILLMDADMATPISELDKLLNEVEQGADIAIGSRYKLKSTGQPFIRKLMSFVLQLIKNAIGFNGIKDTQCGFKLYNAKIAKTLASLQKVYGFGFDLEHLYLAKKLHYRVSEIPVKWVHQEGSKVSPLKDGFLVFIDLIRLPFIHKNTKLH